MLSESTPAIETHLLGKRYWRQEALRDVTFTLPQGSICALLGSNGAGKTTLLRLLAGLISPSRGQSTILGSDTRKLKPADWQRIAYVSESQELPLWMTVKDLISYCQPLYQNWDQAFCDQLLQEFDLPINKRLRSFSRGMRMKAALLVSLAPRPSVILLDEPFSGLDPLVREELIGGLLEWSSQAQWSVLLASHDLEEVERLADRLALIDQGQITLNESIDTLQDRYRNVSGSLPVDTPVPNNIPQNWREFQIEGGRFSFVDSDYQDVATLETHLRQCFPGKEFTFDPAPMALRQLYLSEVRHLKERTRKQTAA